MDPVLVPAVVVYVNAALMDASRVPARSPVQLTGKTVFVGVGPPVVAAQALVAIGPAQAAVPHRPTSSSTVARGANSRNFLFVNIVFILSFPFKWRTL